MYGRSVYVCAINRQCRQPDGVRDGDRTMRRWRRIRDGGSCFPLPPLPSARRGGASGSLCAPSLASHRDSHAGPSAPLRSLVREPPRRVLVAFRLPRAVVNHQAVTHVRRAREFRDPRIVPCSYWRADQRLTSRVKTSSVMRSRNRRPPTRWRCRSKRVSTAGSPRSLFSFAKLPRSRSEIATELTLAVVILTSD